MHESLRYFAHVRCRPNYEGDPFVNCVLNPCLTSPCGINADCERNGDRAICNCRDGYAGDPFVRYGRFISMKCS